MQDTPIRKLCIFPSLFLYQEAQISKLDPYFGLVLSIVVNTGYDYELYMHDGIFCNIWLNKYTESKWAVDKGIICSVTTIPPCCICNQLERPIGLLLCMYI